MTSMKAIPIIPTIMHAVLGLFCSGKTNFTYHILQAYIIDTGTIHDVIKWKHFLYHWPFVRGIHCPLMNSPNKGQWRGALMFSLVCTLNKRLSKQSWGWWFETSSRSLWHHYNAYDCHHATEAMLQDMWKIAIWGWQTPQLPRPEKAPKIPRTYVE